MASPRESSHDVSMVDSERIGDAIERVPSAASARRQKLVTGGLVVLGLAFAATGVAAVFTADSDAGAAALLTIG